jgi:hypothetical protein
VAGGGSGNIEHRTLNVEILEHCCKEAPVLRSGLWNYGGRAKESPDALTRITETFANGKGRESSANLRVSPRLGAK